jgi:hypothetical protein
MTLVDNNSLFSATARAVSANDPDIDMMPADDFAYAYACANGVLVGDFNEHRCPRHCGNRLDDNSECPECDS